MVDRPPLTRPPQAMPRKPPLPNPALVRYSQEHLKYELAMFFWTSEILKGLSPPERLRDEVVNNALIESFAVHFRNLITFFYPDNARPQDVLAEDFIEDPEGWKKLLPALSPSLRDARRRAELEVGQLTTAHIAGPPPEKGWPAPGLVDEVRALLKLFVEHASLQRLDPSVKDLL